MFFFLIMFSSVKTIFNNYEKIPNYINADLNKLMYTEVDNRDREYSFNRGIESLLKAYKNIKKNDSNVEKIAIISDLGMAAFNNSDHPTMVLTEDTFSLIKNFGVKEGRNLKSTDFTNKTDKISVLIGEQVAKKNKCKIGDYIKTDLSDNDYDDFKPLKVQVVGILKSKLYFPKGNITWTVGDLDNFDEMIICPLTPKTSTNVAYVPGMYFLVKDEKKMENSISVINKELKNQNYRCDVTKLNQKMKEMYDETVEDNYNWLAFSITIVFFSIICIAIVIVSMIYTRRYEIGVKIAIGYSKKSIIKSIIAEIAILQIIATILSCVFVALVSVQTDEVGIKHITENINFLLYLYASIICFITLITVALIVIYNINRLQPKELIGGKD